LGSEVAAKLGKQIVHCPRMHWNAAHDNFAGGVMDADQVWHLVLAERFVNIRHRYLRDKY
jgi:hypothetical protein